MPAPSPPFSPWPRPLFVSHKHRHSIVGKTSAASRALEFLTYLSWLIRRRRHDRDGTFKGAIKQLEAALKDFYAGDTEKEYTLENAVESWSKIVCNHPDYVRR